MLKRSGLDGFNLITVHKLSSKEKWQSWDSNPGLLGEKRERYLCAEPCTLHRIEAWCKAHKKVTTYLEQLRHELEHPDDLLLVFRHHEEGTDPVLPGKVELIRKSDVVEAGNGDILAGVPLVLSGLHHLKDFLEN